MQGHYFKYDNDMQCARSIGMRAYASDVDPPKCKQTAMTVPTCWWAVHVTCHIIIITRHKWLLHQLYLHYAYSQCCSLYHSFN